MSFIFGEKYAYEHAKYLESYIPEKFCNKIKASINKYLFDNNDEYILFLGDKKIVVCQSSEESKSNKTYFFSSQDLAIDIYRYPEINPDTIEFLGKFPRSKVPSVEELENIKPEYIFDKFINLYLVLGKIAASDSSGKLDMTQMLLT